MRQARVVVTGLGVVSSIGIGWEPFWKSLLAGKSGISEINSFDTSAYPYHRGGEIKEFTARDFIDQSSDLLNRSSQFAIAGTKMAFQDAYLDLNQISRERIGICIGTTMAEPQALESIDDIWVRKGEKSIPSALIRQYPASVISAQVATNLDLRGPNLMITTACAAGNYAISYAYDLLRSKKADIVVAGGADAFSRTAWMGFGRLLAIAPERCQPFDRYRKGMMLGEGSAMLVLERLEDAIARKARIYAEVLGYGLSCDATHMTIPSIEGIVRVLENALRYAAITPKEVSYISAHGTGTPANDKTECAAIRHVFSEFTDHIPISSIKSMIGHTMGAASALEAVSCALAIRYGQIPPTINFEESDPECQIDCVPNTSRSISVQVALNNSFAFGGNNACVVFGKI